MNKNDKKQIKTYENPMTDEEMSVFGEFLEMQHPVSLILKKYLQYKDEDLWKLLKNISISPQINNKEEWLIVGKGQFISNDLGTFFKNAINAYKRSLKQKEKESKE